MAETDHSSLPPAPIPLAEVERPLPGNVYYSREDGTPWSFVGLWSHPDHRDYHVNWTGEYAIVQVYGNFKNELRLIDLAKWDDLFVPAWGPLKVCAFCGFSRMCPCLKRQTCANLTDYRLEPDDASDGDDDATPSPSDDVEAGGQR